MHVLFAVIPDASGQAEGFGGRFEWDVPLLEGYSWGVLPQLRASPRLGSFAGLWSGSVGQALAALSPDAVLLTGWNALPLVQGLRASIQLGLPTVVRGDSNSLMLRPAWKEAGHRLLLSCFDAFVAVGRSNREFYERNGVRPERIVDGGHFVDEEHFRALRAREAPRRFELRRRWGIPENAFCPLFAGKLQPKKRPLDFVTALATVAGRLPAGRIHGLVVGSGELEAEVRRTAETGAVPVTFAGFLNQSEIGGAYAAADVLVLPSDWGETWGLVVNEAMLFGLPAIVSDRVGCGPDLVSDGQTGFIVPFARPDVLAERLHELARDDAARRRLGEKAYARVLGYSPRRGARATIAAAAIAIGGG